MKDGTVINDVKGFTHNVGERAAKTYGHVKEEASELFETGKSRVQSAGRQVGGYVQQYPIRTLLAVAGAGVLLGLLRRSSKKK